MIFDRDIEKLQAKWDTLEYTATIEDCRVDLEAFGTVDFVNEQSGMSMRAYNLILQCSVPAAVKVVDKGTLDGEESGESITFVFD